MRVSIGNYLFRTRNVLFPLLYLTLFLGHATVSQHTVAMLMAGSAIVLLGQVVRIMTVGLDYIVRGGRNRRVYANNLVQAGLFAHCRNPLYLGNLLMIVGFGFAANNLWYLTLTLPILFLAYACIIAAEEYYLEGRFGDVYRQYCAFTPRLVPKLKGLSQTLHDFPFNWRRVLVKEYPTLCITSLMLVMLAGRALNDELTDWLLSASLSALILILCACVRMLKKSGKLAGEWKG